MSSKTQIPPILSYLNTFNLVITGTVIWTHPSIWSRCLVPKRHVVRLEMAYCFQSSLSFYGRQIVLTLENAKIYELQKKNKKIKK